MITLKNISKSYGKSTALSPTDLDIETGKTTVLIGQSGSGKSTLLRLIIGLIVPDGGEVIIDGASMSPANFIPLRRKMGYVIQDGGLFPHLTAEGNVSIMARHLGWEAVSIRERIGSLCELTNFPIDALSRYPRQISGGQRQRVSLMRALILDPDVLLLDEPLGSLDPLIRRDLQNDLKDIFGSLGKTVVMVTHDIGEAAYFGDTIVFLKEGKIIQRGSIVDLVERPSEPFVTRFINAQRSPLESGGTEADCN